MIKQNLGYSICRIGNYEIFDKYIELQGCRKQCTIADLYSEVLITLF